jgi:hypothetical protein
MTLAWLSFTLILGVNVADARTKAEERARFANKVKLNIARLGTGNQALVAIKLRDRSKVSGYISEAGSESFTVVHPKFGTTSTVSYVDVAQVKGHNLSTGAKIAIGIAIGAGAVLVILLIYLGCCTG